jgi:hypothetical protein
LAERQHTFDRCHLVVGHMLLCFYCQSYMGRGELKKFHPFHHYCSFVRMSMESTGLCRMRESNRRKTNPELPFLVVLPASRPLENRVQCLFCLDGCDNDEGRCSTCISFCLLLLPVHALKCTIRAECSGCSARLCRASRRPHKFLQYFRI